MSYSSGWNPRFWVSKFLVLWVLNQAQKSRRMRRAWLPQFSQCYWASAVDGKIFFDCESPQFRTRGCMQHLRLCQWFCMVWTDVASGRAKGRRRYHSWAHMTRRDDDSLPVFPDFCLHFPTWVLYIPWGSYPKHGCTKFIQDLTKGYLYSICSQIDTITQTWMTTTVTVCWAGYMDCTDLVLVVVDRRPSLQSLRAWAVHTGLSDRFFASPTLSLDSFFSYSVLNWRIARFLLSAVAILHCGFRQTVSLLMRKQAGNRRMRLFPPGKA